jgi:hypothetical protein
MKKDVLEQIVNDYLQFKLRARCALTASMAAALVWQVHPGSRPISSMVMR